MTTPHFGNGLSRGKYIGNCISCNREKHRSRLTKNVMS